jgi:hypothetical protein
MPPRPHAQETAPPLRIGWKEYLDLPALGLRRLKGKIDTGARTSTLHVHAVTYLERPAASGAGAAEITLAPERHHPGRLITARVQILRHLRVTDSGGHHELRPLIETELLLGPVRKKILLTLTDRSGMRFRMILGRKAVEGDFWIDPARKYLLRAWHRRRPRRDGAPR